ncbi:MAG: hypothetical protein LPK26_12430 [Bacillaceae bacterium]|nr:hypothetical protein [Bacillaceae bacterium]
MDTGTRQAQSGRRLGSSDYVQEQSAQPYSESMIMVIEDDFAASLLFSGLRGPYSGVKHPIFVFGGLRGLYLLEIIKKHHEM